MDSSQNSSLGRLAKWDLVLLCSYSFALFGIAIVSHRPLTLHECVLPQTARSMLADHDFVVPKIDAKPPGFSGASMPPEPWLENPPLPQWITVAIASVFGHCDSEAIVRIGPALVSVGAVLCVAWMMALWYGRALGILGGLAMATTLEFTRYAWSAEDEIFLCAILTAVMALFVKNEFGLPLDTARRSWSSVLFGRRSIWLVLFFCVLGATNLVKGLFFGTVMVGGPIAVFLLGTFDIRRISKYLWVWGAVLYLAVMFAWPLAIYARYPDVTDLWFFDLHGRVSGNYKVTNAPLWYYPVNLLWMAAPWTLLVPFGLKATWRRCKADAASPERFLWCWAFVVPAVFSIPHGKHHHYLLPALAPWAILGALGAQELRRILPSWPTILKRPALSLLTIALPLVIALAVLGPKIPGPRWLPYVLMFAAPPVVYLGSWGVLHPNPKRSAATVFGLLLCGYWAGHCYSGLYVDRYRADVAFLKAARMRAETERLPVFVDMGTHPFHGMIGLFYQNANARLLHDLSFLSAAEISAPEILLISLSFERDRLRQWGDVEQLDQSPTADRGVPHGGKLTLYRLRFRQDIARVPVQNIRISPLQAMHRQPGPSLASEISAGDTQPRVTPVVFEQPMSKLTQ